MFRMADWISILGIVAGCCTTGASVPQVLKIIKTRKTRDISLMMYCAVTLGVMLWITYGVLIKNFPVVLANMASFVLVTTILIFKIKYK